MADARRADLQDMIHPTLMKQLAANRAEEVRRSAPGRSAGELVEPAPERPRSHHLGTQRPYPIGELPVRGDDGDRVRIRVRLHARGDVVIGRIRPAAGRELDVYAGRAQVKGPSVEHNG